MLYGMYRCIIVQGSAATGFDEGLHDADAVRRTFKRVGPWARNATRCMHVASARVPRLGTWRKTFMQRAPSVACRPAQGANRSMKYALTWAVMAEGKQRTRRWARKCWTEWSARKWAGSRRYTVPGNAKEEIPLKKTLARRYTTKAEELRWIEFL
jgi:hypothetical protein